MLRNQKGFTLLELCVVFIVFVMIVGEIGCIVKFFTSDFESPYKREVIYGVSAITGIGSVVGYFDIQDGKK